MIFLYLIPLHLIFVAFLLTYVSSGIHRSFWTKISLLVPHRLHAPFEVVGESILILLFLSLPVMPFLLFGWYLESIGSYIP